MTGLTPFSLEKTDCFERTFKKRSPSRNRIPGLRRALAFRELAKSKAYSKGFASDISKVLEDLLDEPYPISSRDEPLPGGTSIPYGWTLHKLEIRIGKGASGQVRLIYLVSETERIIRPLWLYSHEQFTKRPPDKDLGRVIRGEL